MSFGLEAFGFGLEAFSIGLETFDFGLEAFDFVLEAFGKGLKCLESQRIQYLMKSSIWTKAKQIMKVEEDEDLCLDLVGVSECD